jgi:predicted CoA-substrate-specific enzyme activase
LFSIGIDIGSVCTKGAVYDGVNLFTDVIPTGWNLRESGDIILRRLMNISSIKTDDSRFITATGYGRDSIAFADKKITEITCHARGAHFFNPQTRTVIDVGGQDSKAIAVGEKGQVIEFIMNDRCAAGTGRFLQVMSHVLGSEVDELEELARGSEPAEINSMCAVFAESEVISLLARGISKESIAAGILESISGKIIHLTGRVRIADHVIFTGGVSQNSVIRKSLGSRIGLEITTHPRAQFAGAVGAAIIGFESINKS